MKIKTLIKALNKKERRKILHLLLQEMSGRYSKNNTYCDEPDGLTVGEWLEKIPTSDLPRRLYNFLKKVPHLPIAEVDDRYRGFGNLMRTQLECHREMARELGYFKTSSPNHVSAKRHLRDTPAPQFIKLTEAETKEERYYNIIHIKGFEVINGDKATKLINNDNDFSVVEESAEEILSRILDWTSTVTKEGLRYTSS